VVAPVLGIGAALKFNTLMRTLLICLLICFYSCNTDKKETIALNDTESSEIIDVSLYTDDYKRVNILDIPKEWEMVTVMDNNEVVYYPCDKANLRFKIERKNGQWTLNESTGKNVIYYSILNTLQLDNELVIICKDYHNHYDKVIIFKVKNFTSDTKKCYWSASRDGFEQEMLFVNEKGLSEVKLINQPCSDCWEDCE